MNAGIEPLIVRLKPESLDDVALGIVRLSAEGSIQFMNRAARQLAGPAVDVGSPLASFPLPADSERIFRTQFEERRRTERGNDYPLVLERTDLGTKAHVEISALPEYDAEGNHIGSVGLINDVTMQRTNLSIHESIAVAFDRQGLLQALDSSLREVFNFDSILVSLISTDRNALRLFYERSDGRDAMDTTYRWWPMPAFVKADLDRLLTSRADDIDEMFDTPPYDELKANDPDTVKWLEIGYRHMLRRPVFHNGRLVAIVSLMRSMERPFDRADERHLDQLPIGETVNMALAIERKNELSFALDLIGQLGGVAGRISDVASVLVEQLREHFKWEHVSLFRVNADENTVSIVQQSAQSDSRLPDDFSQPSELGLLGYVVQSEKAVRVDDVSRSKVYRKGIENTRSEMCLPVPGDRVRWILNVESSLRAAFAGEEQIAVEQLLGVAGLILDRTLAIEFNATVLESVADAIIQTTSKGRIQNVNPACEKLLNRTRDALVGMHLSALIGARDGTTDSSQFADDLIGSDKLISSEILMLPLDGDPVPVLLSGESLPPQIGGKVFVASDLRPRIEVQRMDTLQRVFRQVASEIRLPIALAMSNLEELEQAAPAPETADIVRNTITQLRRADLPLERVVRLATAAEGQELPLAPTSLRDTAQKLLEQLSATQRSKVSVTVEDDAPLVLAARPELEFCASSLIAFLLRVRAQRDQVIVRIAREQSQQVLACELIDMTTALASETRLEARSEHEREFALAEPVIQSLMQRMRGSFELSQQRGGLALRLSLSEVEAT